MEVKKCNTLEEVRHEIDLLDTKIVELIAARNDYIHQAAGFKNSVEEVKAEDRVDFVLQKVRHQALAAGVSPNLVSKLYEIMIEEMVESEIAEFRNRKAF
jgi:isochorismate pyruvate lyase